ncbi:phosphoribosylanthranilate isomerase [Antarcticibacterium arcticum]|uniref:N-(5'-phosphoribosyl)anthranilate isomerase n=1 Tax=Antarcticibacterium arcticum TaxID=2585771 RepID=A0A5B8YHL4_9FLAO|nr:phosphoribosylanthranilate isomerase [Antarcticibacterium arcticum]QED36307.1 phosphoribosylanthranilate isomerase [Antarcticibacterium arcticum]
MGTPGNIREMESLKPDYLGFIFYEASPRNFINEIPEVSEKIKKTGVFVDASEDFIVQKTLQHKLNAIQLHGDESPEYCRNLRVTFQNRENGTGLEIFKVFAVNEEFDFSILNQYEGIVDFFLFDTKGGNKGGNGIPFNWELLKNYSSVTPFFLSGGIGLEDVVGLKKLKEFFEKTGKSRVFYGIDVNSKFEISPGEKDKNLLEEFSKKLTYQGLR